MIALTQLGEDTRQGISPAITTFVRLLPRACTTPLRHQFLLASQINIIHRNTLLLKHHGPHQLISVSSTSFCIDHNNCVHQNCSKPMESPSNCLLLKFVSIQLVVVIQARRENGHFTDNNVSAGCIDGQTCKADKCA